MVELVGSILAAVVAVAEPKPVAAVVAAAVEPKPVVAVVAEAVVAELVEDFEFLP